MSVSYNIFLYGYDKDIVTGKQLYSSYIEASYIFQNATVFCGMTPYKSFYADKLDVVNLGITLSKEILQEMYPIGLKTSLIVNPDSKHVFANVTFSF